MDIDHSKNLLQQSLMRMIKLESYILETLKDLSGHIDYPRAAEALNGLYDVAVSQQKAIANRLLALDGVNHVNSPSVALKGDTGIVCRDTPLPTYEALQTLYGRLNEAAFGYAGLHLLAHRYFDSSGEGNTADLAEKHMKSYAQAAQSITQLSSDALVAELGELGQECQCQCPSCGLGLCLCSPHGSNTVNDAWREALRVATESGLRGVRVRAPRAKSPADRAGLQLGDIIVAVDNQELGEEGWDTIKRQQDAIRKHQSGEVVVFRVQRAHGALEEISVTRP